MKVDIRDNDALQVISPAALSAYARAAGWSKIESYGNHSDVYAADRMPEIILPRTQRLGDYANVVSRLIKIFAKVAERDELSLYRDLVTADRDIVRIRAGASNNGSLAVNDGLDLIRGSRDMLLAAACSLREPQPLYRAGANKEASNLLRQVQLGQTEQGSFVVTLLTPVVSPPIQKALFSDNVDFNEPFGRQMTRRLTEALRATREAIEKAIESEADTFAEAVEKGVSANLCEALVKLIEPFPTLDVSVVWARTRPRESAQETIRFAPADAPILGEAARVFQDQEPQPDRTLFGMVQQLRRDETEADGTISLRTSIDGQNRSVSVLLNQSDYEKAIQAHKDKAPVILKGDLERTGQRWRLLNPRITDIIREDTSQESKP